MNSTWKQLFYWMFLFLQVAVLHGADHSCTSYLGNSGNCVPIRECPNLFKLVSRPIISGGDQRILRESMCGNHGMVCCETSPADESPKTSSMTLPDTDVCGLDRDGQRLVSGNRAEIDQFRWTVALEYKKPDFKGVKCGGSLINTRYILTAAHCVLNVTPHELTVRLEEWDLDNNPDCDEDENCADGVRFEKIDRIVVHPEYKRYQNNIALLRLKQALPTEYTNYIMPICLPTPEELRHNSFSERKVGVAGWTTTDSLGYKQKQFKMFTELVTSSVENCTAEFHHSLSATRVNRNHICANWKHRDACGVDSGSPLQINLDGNYYLIGVLSRGNSCGTLLPSIFTRITPYVDWILDNILE